MKLAKNTNKNSFLFWLKEIVLIGKFFMNTKNLLCLHYFDKFFGSDGTFATKQNKKHEIL